jgi:hypothetical protein
MLTRTSDLVGFEKLLANTGNIFSELAGIWQRAVDAASQVTHAVGIRALNGRRRPAPSPRNGIHPNQRHSTF